jgi:hypothetical protein
LKHLEGHERYEIDYLRGRMTYVVTVPLCETCHAFVHLGYLETRLNNGEIEPKEYAAVMVHGWTILRDAGLMKLPYRGPMAEWGRWQLVIGRDEFPPRFKSRAEWEAFFHGGLTPKE